MSFLLFILKYITKTLHILSFGLILGNLSYDVYFGNNLNQIGAIKGIALILNITLIISGLINYLLIIYENKLQSCTQYNIYRGITLLKILITIMGIIIFQNYFSFQIFLYAIYSINLLISPFLRFYREHFVPTEKIEKYHIFEDSK